MKKTKSWILSIPIIIGTIFASCEQETPEPLRRAVDDVSLTYNAGSSAKVSVRYAGNWTTRIECKDAEGNSINPWFTATPSEGLGDGEQYQWIEITAERNAGAERSGKIFLIGGGAEQAITVTQADGRFVVPAPVVKGNLKAGEESSAYLEIAWEKAFGNEEYTVDVTLSGTSDGITVAAKTSGHIENEGSGSIAIPLSGTPTALGELVCHVVFKMDGVEKFNGDVAAAVLSTNEVFSHSFDLFVWGGHYDTNQKGVAPGGKQAGKEYNGTEPGDKEVSAGTDGAMDAFLTMTEEYRINRGIEKWSGSKVYEHPGYLKLGTGSAGATLITPALESLSSSPEDVVVSIDFLRFDNEEGTYFITAEGAGEISGGTIDAKLLPAPTKASERKWTTLKFTVKGATNQTRIKLQCEKSAAGYRVNVDNYRVMGAAKQAVTEPLIAPDAENITFTPAATSITLSWDGVKGASSYAISLAPQETPDFKKTANTPNATYTFGDLKPGFYIFTLQAICEDNRAFDSEEVSTLVGTSGFPVKKLETPTNFKLSPSVSTAELSWDAVKSASGYRITVNQGENEFGIFNTANTSYTIEGLSPNTVYTVSLKAVVGDTDNDFDSESVSAEFKTLDPDPLTKPSIKLYAKSYAYAVVEFIFNKDEQATSKFGIRVFDGEKEIRKHTFNFDSKYTRNGTRFIITGLEASHSYSAQIYRVTTDKNAFLDSDWSDKFQFTTEAAPDKSGYLLWSDFDNHAWGGNGPMIAFGIDPSESDKSFNVITGVSNSWNVASPVKNMDNIVNGVGANISGGQKYYHETFMSGWTTEDIKAGGNSNTKGTGSVYLCAGMMKFGTGSAFGRLDFPKFTSLTGENTLEFTFDASPYVEPNKTTGKIEEEPAAYECEEFEVSVVAGPGTITKADGETVSGTSAVLKNKSASEMKADTQGFVSMTPHTIIVSGATSETIFSVKTGHGSKQYRMWFDNAKVRKL